MTARNFIVGNDLQIGSLVLSDTSGNLTVSGNISVSGAITATSLNTVSSSQLEVSTPLVYLTGNTYPYNFDIGLYSHFKGGPANVYAHTGFVRSYQNGYWGLFSNVKQEPAGTVTWNDTGLIWDSVKVGAATIANSTASTSTITGALVVAGGAGIGGSAYIGASLIVNGIDIIANTASLQNQITGANVAWAANAATQQGLISTLQSQTYSNSNVNAYLSSVGSGNITISNGSLWLTASGPGAVTIGSSTAIPVITTDSYGRISGATTAAVVAPAGTLTGATLASGVTASSLTSVGTLTGLTVSGESTLTTVSAGSYQGIIGNVTPAAGTFTSLTASSAVVNGTVTASTINAVTIGNSGATLTGTVSTAAQPNITSVGTLTGLTLSGNVTTTATGYIQLPSGTTAQRPVSPSTGYTRFNTTNNGLEVYGNSAWILVGAKDGSSYGTAADSATAIYDLGVRGKGLYWIKKADGTPIQVYCDLDTLGQDGKGGWMLVGSWATASEWTKDSVSSSATFSSTALNCFSSNFGNTNMQHMRVKVSAAIDTASASSEADFYFYWSSAIQWKQVWANGSGTNNHYNSATGVNAGSAIQRNSLRQFSYSYNLKFGYTGNTQTWNNLSDTGTSGSTGTEAWYDWYSGLTTAGYTLGVYNAGGAGRQDGTLAIIYSGDTSTTAGQDCNNQNAKYGYDDNVLTAWGGTTATNNLGANTGTQGSNTNLWMWIK